MMRYVFLLLTGLYISLAAVAQDVQYPVKKYVQKHQYDKAVHQIDIHLAADSNDLMYLYSGSVVYMQYDYKGRSFPQAYNYVARARIVYDQLADRMVRKYMKKGLDDIGIQAQIDTIAYRDACAIKLHPSEEEYNRWLETYRLASPYIAKRITQYRNTLAWQQADREQTVAAYEAFIARYPDADEVAQAKQHILHIHYIEAERENTIEAYERFIRRYPKSERVNDARQHVYALAYKQAVEENTSEAIVAFIQKYPTAPQRVAAEKLVSYVAYEEAKAQNTAEAYDRFAAAYSLSAYVTEARCRAALLRRDVEEIETVLPMSAGAIRDSCVAILHTHYSAQDGIGKMQWLERYYHANLPIEVKDKYAAIALLNDSTDAETYIRTVAPYRPAMVVLQQQVEMVGRYSWQEAMGLMTMYEEEFGEDETYWALLEEVNLKAYKEAQDALQDIPQEE